MMRARSAVLCTQVRRVVLAVALAAVMPVQTWAQGNQADLADVDWRAVLSEVEGFPGVPLFEMPRVFTQTRLVADLAREGQPAAAKRVLETLIARYPYVADFHTTRALLLVRLGEVERAITALDRALDLGYQNIGQIRRAKGWDQLTDTMAFREVAAKDRTPPAFAVLPTRPTIVDGQNALVTAVNTDWVQGEGTLRARFAFPQELSKRNALGHDGRGPVDGIASRVLRGRGAGLAGVLYDNRDGDHSTLRREDYPRLSFVEYSEEAKARQLHYGLSEGILFNAPTIGNSSTALTSGPLWRSQARRALTDPGGPRRLAQLYARNHLYVYPEHRDHDPIADGGRGDLFPANTPLLLVSQGSSGSDKVFLQALAHILAAMSPETRRSIEARRLVAPTLQMALRRGMRGIDDDAERYMSGAAHPSAFDGEAIDFDRMVAIASRLTPETVPPAVGIGVLQDWDAAPGVDIFGEGLSETLFSTPFAIAKVWRSSAMTRRLVLGAGADGALDEAAARFEWRLLRGDPERVRMVPEGERGERLALEIDWHGVTTAAKALPAEPDITSNRVDIGVFARYGDEVSAPAILSILFPPYQHRVRDGDGPDGRLGSIDFTWAGASNRYADPLIFPLRDWTDEMFYGPDGEPEGWSRSYHDGRPDERYNAQGLVIIEPDGNGRPLLLESVTYPMTRTARGFSRVDVRRTGERFRMVYEDESARRGVMTRELPPAEGGAGQQ